MRRAPGDEEGDRRPARAALLSSLQGIVPTKRSLPDRAESGSLAESAAWATMQKPRQPGDSKLSVLGSTGSKKAIGASQVGRYLGAYVRTRLASTVELLRWADATACVVPMLVASETGCRSLCQSVSGVGLYPEADPRRARRVRCRAHSARETGRVMRFSA